MSARRVVMALAAAAAVGACGGESETDSGARTPTPAGGAGALGGGAQTATLARQENVQRPRGRLVWSAWRVALAPGRSLRHRHGTATVFAEAGEHRLTGSRGDSVLAPGKGASVVAGDLHRHEASSEEASTYSEVVLAAPGSRLPRAPDARRLFQSDVLRGVPERSTLQFIEVRLPPGSETSVHTHPGPEFIAGTKGRFDYENAIEGARKFGPGDTAGIPPGTAVQKRNREDAEAVFLSWFLVDPDKPFAPGARFSGR